jgi:hypothetical protein
MNTKQWLQWLVVGGLTLGLTALVVLWALNVRYKGIPFDVNIPFLDSPTPTPCIRLSYYLPCVTPTPTLTTPTFAQGEATALVKERCTRLAVAYRGSLGWSERYTGNGIWRVTLSVNYGQQSAPILKYNRWNVYERTGAIEQTEDEIGRC